MRIGGSVGFGQFEDRDVAAGKAIGTEIGLVGGDKEVAGRDGHGTFRTDAGGQRLDEFGLGASILVDRDERGTLHADHQIGVIAEVSDVHAFRLDTLGVGALVRIMAELGGQMVKRSAAVEQHFAGLVEDREAA